jgi:hypothetical protein
VGQGLYGPLGHSLFARIGLTASTVVPLLILTLGLVGHGVRENSAAYISAAGHLLAVTLMGGYALNVASALWGLGSAGVAFLIKLGILAVALWGVAWLATGRWRHRPLLAWQAILALALSLGTSVAALPALLSPAAYPFTSALRQYVEQAGSGMGWAGLLAATALALWCSRLGGPTAWTAHILGLGGLLAGILAACTAAAWTRDGWVAYHTLSVAWTLAGLFLLASSWAGSALPRVGPVFLGDAVRARCAAMLREILPGAVTRRWVEGVCLAVLLLALWGMTIDPAQPCWSFAATLVVSVLLGADAVWSRRPVLVYVSGLLVCLAGYLLWRAWMVAEWEGWREIVWQPDQVSRFLYVQIACLAVASICWALVELRLRRLDPPVDLRGPGIAFVHAAVLAAVQLLALLILAGIVSDLLGSAIHVAGPLAWAAWSATLVAAALCFWDPEASRWGLPLPSLYGIGLLALALGFHGLALTAQDLAWAAPPALAGYALVVALLAWQVPRAPSVWRRLGIPTRGDAGVGHALLVGQMLVGLLVLGVSVWLCLDDRPRFERLSGPLSVALLTLTAWILIETRPEAAGFDKPGLLRRVTLVLGFLTVLELAQALLDPAVPVLWLHRSVLLLAVLAVFAAGYASDLAKTVNPQSAWATDARRLGAVLGVLGVATLAAVLLQEFLLYDPQIRRVPLAWPAAALTALLLCGCLVGALWVALEPRWDPFELTARGRSACVFGAEAILVLLLLHLRLNVPDLFPAFLGRHWTLVMMALGFLGVGLAELFQRRGVPVLAKPLQQTGLFLPLLPLLAFLVRGPLTGLRSLEQTIPGLQPLYRYLDRLPDFATHAVLWFLLGALYTLVAILRRSSVFALLAALAANFGLWVLYANAPGLAFLLHPQLWLIPLGIILLAAEHVERGRLTEAQSQGARYLGLLLIYISSTADMFITGLGQSVLLPVVLAVLAIGGVLAGILFRVRAFMFLGAAFLFLVVFSQIWHAAVDRAQTWVWWACGLVLGIAILTLFALFEKRRNDVLRVIEQIKGWR